MKEAIVHTAREMFYQHGYKAVTTQDLADELGISKKTLYNHFTSKYELLIHVVDRFKQQMTNDLENVLLDDSLSYPELLKQFLTIVGTSLSKIDPQFIQDIQYAEPEVWQSLRTYRREAAYIRFRTLIDRGVQDGYILPEVKRGVLVTLYASAIYSMMDLSVIEQLPEEISDDIPMQPEETFEEIVKILFKGILTPKGRVELIKHKNAEPEPAEFS